jgi:hypothetical protein
MSSSMILIGQALPINAHLIASCNTTSGVDIIPPQCVTRANCRRFDQLKYSRTIRLNQGPFL